MNITKLRNTNSLHDRTKLNIEIRDLQDNVKIDINDAKETNA
jgi:hypothetical protein